MEKKDTMPKLWLLRGIKKGILTTKYPGVPPSDEEIPRNSMPPVGSGASNWEMGHEICPTGAIEAPAKDGEGKIDLGKCVYCHKCSEAGFEFSGTDNSTALQSSFSSRISEMEASKLYRNQRRAFKKSFHILMIDVGSCNACNLEVLNVSNPYYDLQRLGIFFTNSPKHADALVVVGALNKAMVDVLKRTYESVPDPKLVIAAGACSISGGVFHECESFASPVKEVIPVDVVIPGCPPSPVQILEGLLIAMGKIKKV
ncbi:MAG: NADH-quinone oxidoreductase subunit B family protein [Nitrososphaerales archaeon]